MTCVSPSEPDSETRDRHPALEAEQKDDAQTANLYLERQKLVFSWWIVALTLD